MGDSDGDRLQVEVRTVILNSSLPRDGRIKWDDVSLARLGFNTGNALIGAGLRRAIEQAEILPMTEQLCLVRDAHHLSTYLNSHYSRVIVIL